MHACMQQRERIKKKEKELPKAVNLVKAIYGHWSNPSFEEWFNLRSIYIKVESDHENGILIMFLKQNLLLIGKEHENPIEKQNFWLIDKISYPRGHVTTNNLQLWGLLNSFFMARINIWLMRCNRASIVWIGTLI